jgi:hypothetical protein
MAMRGSLAAGSAGRVTGSIGAKVVGIAHVSHDEPALAVSLDQGRELGRRRAGWMHDQEPAIGACLARPATKLGGGEASNLMSDQADQPLGLLSKRRQGWQRGWHAGASGTGGAKQTLG